MQSLLTVSDQAIARVNNGVLTGLMPGQGMLQVQHPRRGLIGQAAFNVTSQEVQVLFLDVELAAAPAVSTSPAAVRSISSQISTLTVPRFVTYRQSRIDVSVSALFSDGTRSQLTLVDGTSTSVKLVSFNDSIVTVTADPITGARHLRAVGQADGSVVEVTWNVCGLRVSGIGSFNISLNQHPPVFVDDTRSVRVPESTAVGSSLIKVVAIDDDLNVIHSSIEYDIVGGNTNNVFRINATTGDVVLNQPLDFEMVQMYTITVRATDREQRLALLAIGSGSGMDESAPATQMVSYWATFHGTSFF